jgi:hypothetical protein
LTGKRTFASALTAALASGDLFKRLQWIEVERGGAKIGATIFFKADKAPGALDPRIRESQFGARVARFESNLAARVTLCLSLVVIQVLVELTEANRSGGETLASLVHALHGETK